MEQNNRRSGGDYGYSIIQTTDGGYAMLGTTVSFGAGNLDMYIVKLTSSGSFQWGRTIGGTNHDYGYTIIQTTDGGFEVLVQLSLLVPAAMTGIL